MKSWSPTELSLLKDLLPAPLLRALRKPEPAGVTITETYNLLSTLLGSLVPFVPSPVVDLHLARPDRGRIVGLPLTGTVLRATLSGFVPLSSQLATAGREGAEELSALVNQLFGALVKEIVAYGGGVLQFGGDGLSAFFDASRLGGRHATLAAAAALALQQRMADFAIVTTSAGDFPLKLRSAIHSGKMFAAEVGDETHTELLVTGSAINRVVVAHEAASRGEIVVTEETVPAIEGAQVRQKLTGLYLLEGLQAEPQPPAPVSPAWWPGEPGFDAISALLERIDAVKPFMPYQLPERFLQSKVAGEFRPVAVLFSNFYSFNKLLSLLELLALAQGDMSILGRVLNTYYMQIQEVVHRYGGNINKLDMSSAGNRMMALFGAPVAHEDAPQRAAQVALALPEVLRSADREVMAMLRQWAESYPEHRALLRVVSDSAQQRIGVAFGPLFTGLIGTPDRYEYTVMGETLHLAAALLSTAKAGDVLLSGRMEQAVRHTLATEPVEALSFRSNEIPAFRALQGREEPAPLPQHETPLVGRNAELEQLVRLGRESLGLEGGAGKVIMLVGEVGVGKSRLADELLDELRDATPAVLVVREVCQSYEQTIPYALIGRVLRQILRLPPTDDRAVQAGVIMQQLELLAPSWTRFAPLLGPLLNVPLEETELTQVLTPEQRRDRLHDLISMTCLALARRNPLVLVLDDLQWVDASSHALVSRLAVELVDHPLLLLLIYRPGSELAEPWRELGHSTAFGLAELGDQASKDLLRALLRAEPPAELQPLFARTQGVPLFMEEMVRYLIDTGVLRPEPDGQWVIAGQIESAALPVEIEQLVIARLDRLSEGARDLARVASVVGLRFSRPLLAAVSARRNLLPQSLEQLVAASMLQLDDDPLEPTYGFRHALIRDVIYGSLLFARRRELHLRCAEAIEQIYAADLERYQALLGQHYLHAGLPTRAFPHYVAAARQAQTRFALSEAAALYQQSLAIVPEGLEPIVLDEQLADVQALMGDFSAARERFSHCLMLLESEPEAMVQRASLQRKIGRTYMEQGSLDMALEWFSSAIDTIAPVPPSDRGAIEHARILSDAGWVHFRRHDFDQAGPFLEAALALLNTLDAPQDEVEILNRLGGVALNRGDLALAERYVEQSLQASDRSSDPMGQARALNNLSTLLNARGEVERAGQYALQALEINERIGRRRETAVNACNVGNSFFDLGDYQQSAHYLRLAIERAVDSRDRYVQMFALISLSRSLTALDDLAAAEQACLQGHALATSLQVPTSILDALINAGEIALRRLDLGAAAAYYDQAQAVSVDRESQTYGRLLRLAARLAYHQGAQERALALVSEAQALFERLQDLPEVERTRVLRQEISSSRAAEG